LYLRRTLLDVLFETPRVMKKNTKKASSETNKIIY